MALTADKQAELEFNYANSTRHQRLEAVRLAKEVLIENRRLDTVSESSDISSSDITTMAAAFMTYIES
jgi:coenzyme F420-reducing hydrogenase delta subunit|tara:strand:- start:144 stop:347 length:204 start_codon:yes stop_codon:yes gene_type:complete